MNNTLEVIQLLGEENVEKLKNGIVDILLKRVEEDLDEYSRHNYLIDVDTLFNEINAEIEENLKEKMVEKYTNELTSKIDKMIKEKFK